MFLFFRKRPSKLTSGENVASENLSSKPKVSEVLELEAELQDASVLEASLLETSSMTISQQDLEEAGPSKDGGDLPSDLRCSSRGSGASVDAENYFLRQEVDQLILKLQKLSVQFSYEHIKNNDSHVFYFYNGFFTN